MKRQSVKEEVIRKDVYGSMISQAYEPDRLVEVRAWIDEMLAKVPEEFRDAACLEVESIGGYEGEHHTEIEVYYTRPETDAEFANRKAEMKAQQQRIEAQERAQLERLQSKYHP